LGIGILREEGRRKKEEGRRKREEVRELSSVRDLMDVTDRRKNYQLPITHYPLSITNDQFPISH